MFLLWLLFLWHLYLDLFYGIKPHGRLNLQVFKSFFLYIYIESEQQQCIKKKKKIHQPLTRKKKLRENDEKELKGVSLGFVILPRWSAALVHSYTGCVHAVGPLLKDFF